MAKQFEITLTGTHDEAIETADGVKKLIQALNGALRNRGYAVSKTAIDFGDTANVEDSPAIGVEPPANGGDGDEDIPDWPLTMGPREYVARHEDGKHADLARRIIEAEDAAANGEGE